MLSIGWVMFWKAIALACAGAALDYYRRRRTAYRAQGMELRPDKRGVYVPSDPYSRLEWWLRRAAWVLIPPFIAYGVWVNYVFLTS